MTVAFRPGMHDATARRATARPPSRVGVLLRLRYQLLGAALVAVALPGLIRVAVGLSWGGGSMENTLVGTFAAMVLGFLVLHRLTAYPGIWALSFVVPSFAFGYLATVLFFFFLRVDYSRFQFAASFLLAVAWFYYIVILERRIRRPRLLLLSYGDAARLAEDIRADWVILSAATQLDLPFPGSGEPKQIDRWQEKITPDDLPPGIGGVVADFRANLPPHLERFLAQCALHGIPVYHSKQIRESLSGSVEITHLSENMLGSLIPSSVYFRLKRAADVVLALLVLPTFALVGLVAALAIKLDDGGPVLFRQTRIGYRGEPFTIYKFRTMRPNGEEAGFFTRENDDRITRVGHFLRLYRLDELPQIINVLRGDMSWIGPRPEAVPLAEWYGNKIPFYSYRHIVRPGITGWAAVNQGNVAELPAATGKLNYDFFYIKNFSPWLDLLIAVRTLTIVLTGFGAR